MKKGWLIAIVLFLFAAGAGTAAAAYHYGKDDRLPQGFSVGGMQMGGESAARALEKVRSGIAALEKETVHVTAADGARLPALTLKQLGLQAGAEEAVRALERYRDYTWWERAGVRFRGETASSYPLSLAWDEDKLSAQLRKAWGGAAGMAPKNAVRKINDRDEVVYTAEVTGSKVDLAALSAQVKKLAPSSLMDVTEDKRLIVKLPVVKVAPKITVASLKDEGIERKIAEFTTSFATSAAGRSHNVTVTAKALNDTLLLPDEVFAYGKIVDKADKKYGYRKAPVIVKGKLTPGIGGGICQVSSTLYNAILKAGLDVVERRNHSLVVHYLPPGLDATFADGYVNFRFRNSTGKQLLIRTVVHEKRLTVKVFGTLPENVAYRTETKQLRVIPPGTRYVGNNTLAPGEEKQLQKGEPGFIVDTFRIKLVDGKAVSREKLPRSHYLAQEKLIAVHPDDPRLDPPDPTLAPTPDGPVEPV